jgi:hypothetical protein
MLITSCQTSRQRSGFHIRKEICSHVHHPMCLSTRLSRVYHPAGSFLLPLQRLDWPFRRIGSAYAWPSGACSLGLDVTCVLQKQHPGTYQSFFFAPNFFFCLLLGGYLSLLASNCQFPTVLGLVIVRSRRSQSFIDLSHTVSLHFFHYCYFYTVMAFCCATNFLL